LWEQFFLAPSLSILVLGGQIAGEEFPKFLCGSFDFLVDLLESYSEVSVDVQVSDSRVEVVVWCKWVR